MSATIDTYEKIILHNEQWLIKFKSSSIMHLITSTQMDDISVRNRLMDGIQILSNYFQKIMLLRVVLTEYSQSLTLAEEHLAEEFGHNRLLLEERNYRLPSWDPILDSTAAWFIWKMFTLNNVEKTFLIHFVLEGSALAFFTQANQIMQRYGNSKYFVIHAENDEHHGQMGHRALENLRIDEYNAISDIMNQAWEVMITICDRIAFLATKER
jgi:hypothetical protein